MTALYDTQGARTMDGQLDPVKQDIRNIQERIVRYEQKLAVAEQAGNKEEERKLFDMLLSLNNQLSGLQEEKNILLRRQAPNAAGSALVDARGSIQNLLKPLDSWPSPEDFLQYLVRPDGRKIPVSQRAFAKVLIALSLDNFLHCCKH
ncbi:hypothetical protein ABBQ32_005043 [Trebouxia sp. C0010 RCD-2024]